MKYVKLILIFTFLFSGCGTNIEENNNCCPSFILESTQNIKFSLLEIKEKKESYSSLIVSDEERFLCVTVPNIESCGNENSLFKMEIELLPVNSKIYFTGKIKKTIPYGLNTAFNSPLTYFEGKVNNRTVWMASYHLLSFYDHISESETNYNSLKLIKADSNSIDYNCIN